MNSDRGWSWGSTEVDFFSLSPYSLSRGSARVALREGVNDITENNRLVQICPFYPSLPLYHFRKFSRGKLIEEQFNL
jgi:hypothetical protein